MKHKIQKVELFVGVIVLLGGLLTYGLGVHQLLPVPRPDLVVYGTTLIGIILILMGCDIFSKPTKEMQILENDERNIAITNASLANAYKVTLHKQWTGTKKRLKRYWHFMTRTYQSAVCVHSMMNTAMFILL